MTTVEMPEEDRIILTFATRAELKAFLYIITSLKSSSLGGPPQTTQVILDLNKQLEGVSV